MNNTAEILSDMGYNKYLIDSILDLEKDGVNIHAFIEYLYSPSQVNSLLVALESGFDVSKIKDGGFTGDQMDLIVKGLLQRLPVKYINPELSYKEMEPKYYIELNRFGHIYNTLHGSADDIYVDKVISKLYEREPINVDKLFIYQLRLAIEDKLDLSVILSDDYDWRQAEQLRLGILDGVDINLYANPEYSWGTMRILRISLIDQINLVNYAKEGYNFKQLELMRIAISCGISPELLGKVDDSLKLMTDNLMRQKAIKEMSRQ